MQKKSITAITYSNKLHTVIIYAVLENNMMSKDKFNKYIIFQKSQKLWSKRRLNNYLVKCFKDSSSCSAIDYQCHESINATQNVSPCEILSLTDIEKVTSSSIIR